MLGGIVAAGTAKISGAVWGAVRDKGAQTFDGVKESVVATVATVSESARGAGDRFFRRFRRGEGRPEAAGG